MPSSVPQAMCPIFSIEEIIDDLFDEVCPSVGSNERALKPLLAPVLGELISDHNVRELVRDREYYRVDFADFTDYATTPLPPEPALFHYPDNRALLYEGIDRRPEEPLFTSTHFGKEIGFSILDAIVTRSRVFVSATTRLLIYRNPRETYRQQYGSLDPDEVAGATILTTIVFAAKPIPGDANFDRRAYDLQPLEEWDRYYIMPPIPGDREWRFTFSGTYTEYFMDECLQHPGRPGALNPGQVERVRESGRHNVTTYSIEFELGRLALALPSYIHFMYDLVSKEKVAIPQAVRFPKSSQSQAGGKGATKYQIIKSVRVSRPNLDTKGKSSQAPWSPPPHPFAVRDLNNPAWKSWGRQQKKWQRNSYPFPTSTESRTSSVVINIKQPLSYGRDVVRSQGDTLPKLAESDKVLFGSPNGPSVEWRAQERRKLTAGLRYFILCRDRYRCQICGRSAADENGLVLEVDHKVPIDAWGKTEEDNLWTLCRDCNRGKGKDHAETQR